MTMSTGEMKFLHKKTNFLATLDAPHSLSRQKGGESLVGGTL